MEKFAGNVSMNINGFSSYDPVNSWEVKTTAMTDDTLVVYMDETTPNDITLLGGMDAMPEHILGGTLHLANGTTIQSLETEYNPQQSLEWTHWATADGISLAGPYQLVDFKKGEYFSLEARDDYPYPNEWDMETMYAANNTEFDAYYTANVANKTRITSLSYFAPHALPTAGDAYYWAYGPNAATHVKPTTQNCEFFVFKIIDDTNAARVAFEAGQLDFFGSSALGASTVVSDQANPDYVVKSSIPLSGPQLLVFNLLNEHLQKSAVRHAIAYALDKDEMTKINDGFAVRHDSPVWKVYDLYAPIDFKGAGPGGTDLSWYIDDYAIDYDYAEARDLMLANGYQALDSPNPTTTITTPPIDSVIDTIDDFTTVFADLGSNLFLGLSAFAITSVVLLRRFRR
jgi:ABC-type transport system substrate-binding protein